MSRHPSPGPSHPHQFHQPTPHSTRQKPSRPAIGIAAGAEDSKYQAKYKELKRKVKDIETDNDKLHWRVLQAKRNIQRMKFERAILYERLENLPLDDRNTIPALHSGPGLPPPPPSHTSQLGHSLRDARDYHHAPDDHPVNEYPRPTPRVASGSEGRPPLMDPSIPSGIAPPSRSISASHASRRGSVGSIPPLPPLPPPHLPPVQHLDVPRGHSHSSHSSHSHSSPHMHHPSSSHERTSHSRDQLQSIKRFAHPQQHYSEPLPPVQHVLHSPPLSETERTRRHDIHELAGSPHDPHGHARHQPSLIPMSPHHSADSRSTNRSLHAHQRMGPGTYINRGDDYPERDTLERDRDWDRRDHLHRLEMASVHAMHSPPSQRARHRNEYPESHHPSSRVRDEQGYYQEVSGPGGVYPVVSRDGTPGSGGDDRPSRPDSRTAQPYYDQDQQPSQRPRSFRLRPVPTGNADELDFVHEDGRGQRDRGGISGGGAIFAPPPEQGGRPNMDSRKRSRNDDGESDIVEGSAGSSGGSATYPGGRLPDDRGSKRYHRDGHLGRDDES